MGKNKGPSPLGRAPPSPKPVLALADRWRPRAHPADPLPWLRPQAGKSEAGELARGVGDGSHREYE